MQDNRAQGGDPFVFIISSTWLLSIIVTVLLQYAGLKTLHALILGLMVMVVTSVVLTQKL